MEIRNLPGPKERRIKIFRVEVDLLLEAFTTGRFFEIIQGFPDGAVVQRFHANPMQGNCIDFIVEHYSFPIALYQAQLEMIEITAKSYAGSEIQVFKKFFDNALKES